jgi:hypothetical protein
MPNFDERLRRALGRMAEPGEDDPDARLGEIRSRKHRRGVVRRLQVVALTVVVVAGSVGGTFALAHAFGANHRTLAPGGTPSQSPSPSTSSTTEPPIDQIGPSCSLSTVRGDFDADGQPDSAFVFYPKTAAIPPGPCPPSHDGSGLPGWVIDVRWGSGTQGSWPLDQCGGFCTLLAAGDMDGNGLDEVALEVDRGASTSFVEFLQLPAIEQGPTVYLVAGSATPGDMSGGELKLAWGGSVTHQDVFTCGRTDSGTHLLYATSGVLDLPAETQWNVVEKTYSLDFANATATLMSSRDATYPAPGDPNAPPFPVQGTACFPGSNVGSS